MLVFFTRQNTATCWGLYFPGHKMQRKIMGTKTISCFRRQNNMKQHARTYKNVSWENILWNTRRYIQFHFPNDKRLQNGHCEHTFVLPPCDKIRRTTLGHIHLYYSKTKHREKYWIATYIIRIHNVVFLIKKKTNRKYVNNTIVFSDTKYKEIYLRGKTILFSAKKIAN